MSVCVIIPALNEEETIADVVGDVPREIAGEIIVVDNGSDDRTAERAREAGARVVAELIVVMVAPAPPACARLASIARSLSFSMETAATVPN